MNEDEKFVVKGVDMVRSVTVAVFFCMILLSGNGLAVESGKPFVIIGTSGVTGVYYAAGHAVAKVFARNGENENFRVDAESSQGSVENINRVLTCEWTFGIAQADMLYKAMKGEGPWSGSPKEKLRAVAVLHPETMTIIAAADSGIESVYDLKGKTVGNAPAGSADEQNVRYVLKLHGIDPETDLQLSEVTAIDAPEQLKKGAIYAYFYTVGHPNLSLYEAGLGNRPVKLIALDPVIIGQAVASVPYLVRVDIPVVYYDRFENTMPVATIGVNAILFTSSEAPDHQVSAILQALLDDFPRFQRQHPAFASLSRENLPYGTIVPLHPAAYKVYRASGILK